MDLRPDFIVIGAGIAGASAAFELAGQGRVVLLERESLPGYHTTGRSAAFVVENYGPPTVRALTRAGRNFFLNPPGDFSEHALVHPNPMLWIGRPEQEVAVEAELAASVEAGTPLEELSIDEARELCPWLRRDYFNRALCERDALHIDVAGLLESYLRGLRVRGGEVVTQCEVLGLRHAGSLWRVETNREIFEAPVVINAAGAWADRVAQCAGVPLLGLQPKRRTVITFDPPKGVDIRDWPCVIDPEGEFYFKPEGGQLLASPCDETPMDPCDVVPEDYEIALVADRIQNATELEIRYIRRSWAGLRSFVADRAPVIGLDPRHEGFYWLAGQGGFGIMTAPAAARTAAHLVVHGTIPADVAGFGVSAPDFSRLRLAQAEE